LRCERRLIAAGDFNAENHPLAGVVALSRGHGAFRIGVRGNRHCERVKRLAQSFSQGFEVSLFARPKPRECAGLFHIVQPGIFLTFRCRKEMLHDGVVFGVAADLCNVDSYRTIGRDGQQSNRIGM
jgi:hypothetical protein